MDYSKLKVSELKKIAEERGIRNLSSAKKQELVELLENIDKMKAAREEQGNNAVTAENTVAEETAVEKQSAEKATKKTAAEILDSESKKKSAPDKKFQEKFQEKSQEKSQDKFQEKSPKKSQEKTQDKNQGKKLEKKTDKKTDKKTGKKAETKTEKKSGNSSDDRTENNTLRQKSEKKESARESAAASDAVKMQGSDISNKDHKNNSSNSADEKNIKEKNANVRDGMAADEFSLDEIPDEEAGFVSETVSDIVPGDEAANQSDFEQDIESDIDSDADSHRTVNEVAQGILEVMADGYGFIRSDNYMPGEKDIYVSPSQIRKFRLRTGDIVKGPIRRKANPNEKFSALLYIDSVNDYTPAQILKRKKFEEMTPIFPDERIHLDYTGAPVSLRIVDLFSPIGKGQRGMIVSPPKAGKTTLLKQIARRISVANPEMNVIVLLIDERPEEVTDIKESIESKNAEVIYSTFDELPEHHKRVSEMVIERAKRLVESGQDVVILVDSITRLARAYNLTVAPSGRTLSGGLDPAALHMPKKFFGAARNMREGGSLTILATALIDTGSRMDDVVYEEFKGTGNMELVLDRNLQEKRVFPAIDIVRSGTRKDDLLLTVDEREILDIIHRRFHSLKAEDVTEDLLKLFAQTKDNEQFVAVARKLFLKR